MCQPVNLGCLDFIKTLLTIVTNMDSPLSNKYNLIVTLSITLDHLKYYNGYQADI